MLPLLWVFILVACYVVLADWDALPNVFASIEAGLGWPM
jgi:hypothetical protein